MRGALTELHWSSAVQYFDAVGMLLWAADAAFAASAGQSIGGPALMAALLAKPQLVGMQALPHLHRDSLAHICTGTHWPTSAPGLTSCTQPSLFVYSWTERSGWWPCCHWRDSNASVCAGADRAGRCRK